MYPPDVSWRDPADNPTAFEMQTLELRVLLSAAAEPVAPLSSHAVSTPAAVLTKNMRKDLLAVWEGSNREQLQSLLDQSKLGAFDNRLLEYMRSRSGAAFYFDPADAPAYASFINTNLGTANVITAADSIVAHVFPDQAGGDYHIALPDGDINWVSQPTITPDVPDFLHTLNRMEFWSELSVAHALTGQARYVDEMENQLASWTTQNPPLADPDSWPALDPQWWLLDTSVRSEMWTWGYFTVLDSADWDAAANTLFLYNLYHHGDFLHRVTPQGLDSNRTVTHGRSLLMLAQVLPEFSGSGAWETYARNLLFEAMDGQLFNDGSHVEQSLAYTQGVVEDLLEAKWLDQLNGDTWPADRRQRLDGAVDGIWQMLSPDGNRPPIGDTYRTTAAPMFLKASLIQGQSHWPAAKPRVRDVWLFGPAGVGPYMSNPVYPELGNRGNSYALPDSGNFILRSGNGTGARQINFDAGPKGRGHGHFDLLSFELFGGGRPLVADPGPYKYNNSAERNYVISTRAHNTINIDGANHAALEGLNHPGIDVSQWHVAGDHAQITATHRGYQYLPGGPVVTRSLWYDLDGTVLIVDWVESTEPRQAQQSFNLPGTADTVTGVQSDGSFRSRHASGGNVKVSPLARPGQTVARGSPTFVSNMPTGDYKDDAYRFTVTQSGTFMVFATLISAYDGATPPEVSANLITANPAPGQTVQIELDQNGATRTISFTPPQLQRLDELATSRGTYNDVKFDADNRLHLVYHDRDEKNLKYTVRGQNGRWTIPQVIDNDYETGLWPSLAIGTNGTMGVAYFYGWGGDLRYAHWDGTTWTTQTVESKGSVGLYPSLAFSRTNGPVIAYYNRTRGDLRLASSATNGWDIINIDSDGDVGRFPSLVRDPNRPDASKWAVGYEHTSRGVYKYAIQYQDGWKIEDVDTSTVGGGYVSLAFDADKLPAMSYYDAGITALKFARQTGRGWVHTVVAEKQVQGLYTNLYFDSLQRANIFYFDKSHHTQIQAIASGNRWDYITHGPGGREARVALASGGAVAFTNLDESVGELRVTIV